MAEIERHKRAKDSDGDSQQHAKGQSPALILSRHNQEDNEERETKDDRRRDALRSLLLLIRHAHVVEAHLVRHRLMEHILQRRHGLSGTIAGCRGSVDLYAVEEVITHDEFGAGSWIGCRQRTERNHVARGISDIELPEIFGIGSELAVGLDVYLPLQPKAIEVVKQRTTHKCLHGLVEIAEFNLLGHGLGVVYLNSKLRHAE